MITSAFTCTGPYAILIMLGIKRVENRSMCPSPKKGRCAVSCSKSFCKEEFGNFVQWASRALPADQFVSIPAWCDVADWPGKIVGCVDYSCREGGDAESWNEGYRYWWDLAEVASFDRPIRCHGNTGMWSMSMSLAKQVTLADTLARTVGSKVSTAEEAARIFGMAMPLAGENEGFFVLPLDAECHVLSEPILVALGESTTTAVDPAMVFGAALKCEAKSVIVAHNHPSGSPMPSLQDHQLTKSLKRLGAEIGVEVRDHLVVGAEDIYSIEAAQNAVPNEPNYVPNEPNHVPNESKDMAQIILSTLSENPSATIPCLMEVCHVSRETIKRALKTLKDSGSIRRKGGTRGVWEVLKR